MTDSAPGRVPAAPPGVDGPSRTSVLWQRLTQVKPASVLQQRDSARSWMIFLSLVVVLATLWPPHPRPIQLVPALWVTAAMAVTWAATLVPALLPVFNRVGGLVVLLQVHLLVSVTGGEHSIYVPLYLGLLVYGALFYGAGSLLLTFALVTVAVLLHPLYAAQLDAAIMAKHLTQLGVWAIAVVAVYALTERLRSAATTDGATGLVNHATFWQILELEHDRSLRYGRPYSVLLGDLDHFKQVNDTHGHRAGDHVLARVADLLAERVRGSDVVARYGGEEFAVLLPETGERDAFTVATDLRQRVEEAAVLGGVTISLGVASTEGSVPGAGPEEIVEAADRALYAAKEAGRNAVAVS